MRMIRSGGDERGGQSTTAGVWPDGESEDLGFAAGGAREYEPVTQDEGECPGHIQQIANRLFAPGVGETGRVHNGQRGGIVGRGKKLRRHVATGSFAAGARR